MNLVMSFPIAPRRLVWENGLYDYNTRQNYPTEMRDGLASLYKNVGIERRFEFIQHQGGHETRPWLFTVFYPPPSVNNISLGYSDKVANRQQDAPNVIVIEGMNFLDSPSVHFGPNAAISDFCS